MFIVRTNTVSDALEAKRPATETFKIERVCGSHSALGLVGNTSASHVPVDIASVCTWQMCIAWYFWRVGFAEQQINSRMQLGTTRNLIEHAILVYGRIGFVLVATRDFDMPSPRINMYLATSFSGRLQPQII